MHIKELPVRAVWFGFLLLVVLGTVFYFILGQGMERIATQQFLKREQTLVRAQVSNLTSFFQTFGDSIAVLAQLKTVTNPGSAIWEIDTFVKQWRDSGLIGGIILTNKNGTVQFNSSVSGIKDTGVSMADRDYFLWAKDRSRVGEYFAGQPVVSRAGDTKGQVIVPVASPVFRGKVFAGLVVASVKFQPLVKQYFEMMKISDTTEVFLINNDGRVLYSSSGRDLEPEHKKQLDINREGVLVSKERLVAYSPILLGNQNWLFVLAVPAKEANGVSASIYIRLSVMIVLIFLTFLLHGVVVTREVVKRDQNNQNKLK